MHFVVAPSAYKGTFSATEIAAAISAGISAAISNATITCIPIADGGDGTIEAIHAVAGGVKHNIVVRGPLDVPVTAEWLELTDMAVVELASASGIAHLHAACMDGEKCIGLHLDALTSHTFGTGQVLLQCLQSGITNIVVCVGGSASTDGGAGLLAALGARFLDDAGAELSLGGGSLERIASCDLEPLQKWQKAKISVATDVTNPLLGISGAAYIYGPQKGATNEQVAQLDRALKIFADVLELATGRDIRNIPGAGAAGGTAFGLACALGATIIPGFAWISELSHLEERIRNADAVITAEGCLDEQSAMGKATGELAKLCRLYGKPLYAVPAIAQLRVDWQQYGLQVATVSVAGERASLEAVAATARSLFTGALSSEA